MVTRLLSVITALGVLSGCASVRDFLDQIETTLSQSTGDATLTYEDIMETRNVRVGAQNSGRASSAGSGGYKWIPPVVQKMKMPAMVRNGVMIPAHEEYVIINNGGYVMDDDRLSAIRSKYRIPEGVEIVSPLKGNDVVVAVFRLNPVFTQSTVVPIGKVAFLLQGLAMEKAFALMNGELQQVGNSICSFNREKGDDFVTVSVVENGLKDVKTYGVSKSQILFLANGFVLIPIFEKQ